MSWQFSMFLRRSFWSSSSAKGASGRLVLTACITAGIASSRKRLLFVKWMTSTIPKIASWAVWCSGCTAVPACRSASKSSAIEISLAGLLCKKSPATNNMGMCPIKLTHISVALGPQLVFILSALHGSVKQHVLNHGRNKTNLILHHQDCRIPCSFALLSFCSQSHIFCS